jgi:hypothetical protein
LYLIKRIKLFLKEFLREIFLQSIRQCREKLESFCIGTSDTKVKMRFIKDVKNILLKFTRVNKKAEFSWLIGR